MRRPSVADDVRKAHRDEIAALSPSERVDLALELGRRSLDLHCAKDGLALDEARRLREQRLQAQRRPSACLRALQS